MSKFSFCAGTILKLLELEPCTILIIQKLLVPEPYTILTTQNVGAKATYYTNHT